MGPFLTLFHCFYEIFLMTDLNFLTWMSDGLESDSRSASASSTAAVALLSSSTWSS